MPLVLEIFLLVFFFSDTTPHPPPTMVPEPLVCDKGEAYCHDHSKCYPKEAHCDGMEDCPDGSDELNCPKEESKCLTYLGSSICNFVTFYFSIYFIFLKEWFMIEEMGLKC